MNSQEQNRRRTAVEQLEADTGLVIESLTRSIGEQLQSERAAWQHALDVEASRVRRHEQDQHMALDRVELDLRQLIQQMQIALIVETEPLRRGFWGRLGWLIGFVLVLMVTAGCDPVDPSTPPAAPNFTQVTEKRCMDRGGVPILAEDQRYTTGSGHVVVTRCDFPPASPVMITKAEQ